MTRDEIKDIGVVPQPPQKAAVMDEEMKKKVEEAVLDILGGADMEECTEYKIRTAAAARLGIDLSVPDRKLFVRHVVEAFLLSQKDEPRQRKGSGKEKVVEGEEMGGEGGEEKRNNEREVDDNGDLIVCHLSNKRRVTIQAFRGRTLVSIREFYEKDGKQLPSSKGISLTADQWAAFRNAVPDIEAAIEKLQ